MSGVWAASGEGAAARLGVPPEGGGSCRRLVALRARRFFLCRYLGRLRRGQGAKGGAAPPLRPPTPPITPASKDSPAMAGAAGTRPLTRPRPLCRAQQPQPPQPVAATASHDQPATSPHNLSQRLPSAFPQRRLGDSVTVSGAAGTRRASAAPLYVARNFPNNWQHLEKTSRWGCLADCDTGAWPVTTKEVTGKDSSALYCAAKRRTERAVTFENTH